MFTTEEWKLKNKEILLNVKSFKKQSASRIKIRDWNFPTRQRKPEICCTCC